MAGENDFEVQIGTETADLDLGLRDVYEHLKQVDAAAQGISESFAQSARSVAPLVEQITKLNAALNGAAKGSPQELALKNQLQQVQRDYADAVAETNRVRQQLQAASQDQARARQEIYNSPTGDGRTYNQARLTNDAVNAQITAINTSSEQVAARLAEAAGVAAQRMLRTTQAALEASFRNAEIGQTAQQVRTSTPGYGESTVNQARIAAQRRVAQFGNVSNLDELNAQKQAESDAAIVERIKLASLRKITSATKTELTQRERDEQKAAEDIAAIRERIQTASFRKTLADTKAALAQQEREEIKAAEAAEAEKQRLAKFSSDVRIRSLDAERKAEQAQQDELVKRATAKQPLTIDQRVAQSNELRGAFLNANGGADAFMFQSQLTANYMMFSTAISSLKSAANEITQFDEKLSQFAAITETSKTEMADFRTGLLDLAKDSRFSATELAEAAVQLGQIGLSAEDVTKALKPAVDLATASGSTLAQSVTILTSAMGAFQVGADQAKTIADVFAGTLNATRLNVDQLSQAIQYAGAVAHESGISMTELTAAAGSIAQAGVNSGSTIGTGLRQIIQELTAPNTKLLTTMKELGISLGDIDIRTNGLVGVLENLRKKGFDTEAALRSLDVRAATAFSALSSQTDKINRLQQQILLSGSASESAAKANESLLSTLTRLGNQAFVLVDRGFNPFVEGLKTGTEWATSFIGVLEKLGPLLPIVGTGLAGIATAAAALRIGGLMGGLLPEILALLTGPIGWAAGGTAAMLAMVSYLNQLGNSAQHAKEQLDAVKASQNELSSAGQKYEAASKSIEDRIEALLLKRDRLNGDPLLLQTTILEAQKSFGDLGLSVDANANKVEALIDAYRRLDEQLKKQSVTNAAQQASAAQSEVVARQAQAEVNMRSLSSRVGSAIGMGGADRADAQIAAYLKAHGLGGLDGTMGFLRNGIDPNNPRGGSDYQNQLAGQLNDLVGQRESILSSGDQSSAAKRRLAEIADKIKILNGLVSVVDERIAEVAGIQGARIGADQKARDARAAQLGGDFTDLNQRAVDLRVGLRQGGNAIVGANNLSGMDKRAGLTDLISETQQAAKSMLTELAEREANLIANGANKEDVDAATRGLHDALSGLMKGVTKDLKDLTESIKPEVTADLQQQKRARGADIENQMKRAGAARDPAELNAIADAIRDDMAAISKIELDLIGLKTADPSELERNPSLRSEVAAAKEATTTKLKTYMERLAETRKRLTDQILKFEEAGIDASRQKALAEADKLEKILKDARTTPEKAKELVEQINKLLDEARQLAMQKLNIAGQRDDLKAPGGVLPNITSAPPGTVANEIITALNAAGKGGMANYALGSAQIESSFNPGASNKSGAKGLFQFMPDTWTGTGGGNIWDVATQINNFIKLTDQNVAAFTKKYGRAPTDAETYLMHQQGSGGAFKLLDNPGASAASLVGAAAVTGNGGNLSMTGSDFANHIERQFTTALDRVAGRYTTTSKEATAQKQADEQSKIDSDTAKRKAQVAAEEADNERRNELAKLALVDRQLSAELTTAQSAMRRAQNPTQAADAADKVVDTIAKLGEKALEKDRLSKDGRTDQEKAIGQQDIIARYNEQAQKAAIDAADAVGKQTLKTFEDRVNQLKARLDTLQDPKNANKYSVGEVNTAKQQLDEAERTLKVQGEYEANAAKITELERLLADLKQTSIGKGQQQLTIEEQIAALKQKQGVLQDQVNQKQAAGAKTASMSNALGNGVQDFMKSRGLVDETGRWVDETVIAQKTLSSALSGIAGSFDQMFTGIFTGTKTAKEAFADFAKSILSNLASLLSKSITNDLFKALLGGGKGTDGSTDTGLFGGLGSIFSGLFGGGKALGGEIRMAGGGAVPDSPEPTRDSVLINAMPGEVMLRKSAVDVIGKDKLLAMNAMGNGVLNDNAKQLQAPTMKGGDAQATANVWVVAPDQKPVPGPGDIVHVIADDIARSGTIRQLIKRVQAS